MPVTLAAQGDEQHLYQGIIESFDNKIDTGTGTIRARARFDNKDGALVPGMFVSVKLASGADSRVLLVPEQAVGKRPEQALRLCRRGGRQGDVPRSQSRPGGRWQARRRVRPPSPARRVIVDGLQRVQPGRSGPGPRGGRQRRHTPQIRGEVSVPRANPRIDGAKTPWVSRSSLSTGQSLPAVISVAIFLGGLISMFLLPISEYPEVVPPSIVVKALFPGANPKVIAETVATPLEEQINGTENLLYMFSQAASDGTLTLTVTFKLGTNPDLAQQLVQNRVNQALPRLPEVTRNLGVTTVKSSPDLTMVVPSDLAGRALRHAVPAQLRAPQRQGPAGEDRRHRQRAAVSAPAITPCASG